MQHRHRSDRARGRLVRRRLAAAIVLVALAVAIVMAVGLRNARAVPLVRRAAIALPGWLAGAPPLRVLLMSDIHIGDAAMDARRLDAIVAQANALAPDLVLLGGDYVAGFRPRLAPARGRLLAAALVRLRPRLGTIAVLGNHDNDSDPATIAAALRRAGITVLDNAVAVRGPIATGGIGDRFGGHARPAAVLRRLARLPGPALILSHSPDVAPEIAGPALVLAGHTHCGQIVVPLLGAPSVSRYGDRYRCGLVREGARTTIVTAGLGANEQVPLRFGAPPDMWLVTLGPVAGTDRGIATPPPAPRAPHRSRAPSAR